MWKVPIYSEITEFTCHVISKIYGSKTDSYSFHYRSWPGNQLLCIYKRIQDESKPSFGCCELPCVDGVAWNHHMSLCYQTSGVSKWINFNKVDTGKIQWRANCDTSNIFYQSVLL